LIKLEKQLFEKLSNKKEIADMIKTREILSEILLDNLINSETFFGVSIEIKLDEY
jgi:hypothetical protein